MVRVLVAIVIAAVLPVAVLLSAAIDSGYRSALFPLAAPLSKLSSQLEAAALDLSHDRPLVSSSAATIEKAVRDLDEDIVRFPTPRAAPDQAQQDGVPLDRKELADQLRSIAAGLRKDDADFAEWRSKLAASISELGDLRKKAIDVDRTQGGFPIGMWGSLKAFAVWAGPIGTIVLLLIWVTVILLVIPGSRSWLSARMRKMDINVLGVSLSFENLKDDRYGVEFLYKRLVDRVSKQYQIALDKSPISSRFTALMQEVSSSLGEAANYSKPDPAPKELGNLQHRYCLFVPSYINGELIQATEYGGSGTPSKGKIGRSFSIRYGIIGVAFRSRKVVSNPSVSNSPEELVTKWSLTRKEAERQSSQRKTDDGKVTSASALLAIPVQRDEAGDGDPIGLIFVDITNAADFPALENLDISAFEAKLVGLGSYKNLQRSIIDLRASINFDSKALDQAEGA